MTKNQKLLYTIISIIAALGVVNAGYLSWSAMLGQAPTCFLNSGCDVVAASPHSLILGIPLATFGVFFYAMIFGFALWRTLSPQVSTLRYLLPLSSLGFMLSLYFLYLQAFVIGAYCEYCLFSLCDATAIFIATLYLWLQSKKQANIEL